ncbi:MAG: hypothetical protein K9K67_09945 [Bacteriovoracaceae bacterium]|nr:hypothetical protein [Bacteriovoracaceae bacterium]
MMNTFTTFNALAVILTSLLLSCATGKSAPTKDICHIKKHPKDNLFQVLINEKPINNHFYIHPEALDITKRLAKANRCMK